MKRSLTAITFAILTLINFSAAAAESAAGLALVYKGPGACEEECSESSAEIAKLAGLTPVFVGPDAVDPKIFEGAVVWIQPGGKSSTVAKTMHPTLKENLKRFVAEGGGYVGFCAGGFFATAMVGSTENQGLGLLPGRSQLVDLEDPAVMVDVTWGGNSRHLYWEGGPYFTFEKHEVVEITATYADGTAASARAAYGKGRVYVTGPHPEAPGFWREYFKLSDRDGLDEDLAKEMVVWASGRLPFAD